MRARTLTGIKPTGSPHLGNWLGAIRPALELAHQYESYFFVADYHALTITPDPLTLYNQTHEVAATWLALGLDPEKVTFYRQSAIPEIFELAWILSCFTPKGFMNRAHGYKDKLAKNLEAGADEDEGVNMGFYNYPVLMAADILIFSAQYVPVGKDQKQHLEFARDIALRFNHFYQSEVFVVPEPIIAPGAETLVGLDGRKMSKSYNNTIPLFLEEKPLKTLINRIVTNSQAPEEPKNPDESYIYQIHKLFLNPSQDADLRSQYLAGMGWGKAKSLLFECLLEQLKEPRRKYSELMKNPDRLEKILFEGGQRAREQASALLQKVRYTLGITTKP